MKRTCLSVCCLVFAAFGVADSQSTEGAGARRKDGVVFVNAYPADHGIQFDSPIEIDWRSLAPKHYDNLDKSELAELEKRKDMFGNTEQAYMVTVAPELAGWHFYLISPDGIVELKVEKMKGIVRFGFMESRRMRVDYGSLIGAAVTGTTPWSGGFVAVTSGAAEFRKSDVDLTNLLDALRKNDRPDDKGRVWQTPAIVKAFRLQLVKTGGSYYFIQFVADGACEQLCCESRFAIMTAAPSPEGVASNEYDCDI